LNFKPDTNTDFVATYQSARKILDPQTTKTDANGNYLIKPLEIGTYTVTVTKSGFDNFQITGVEVKLGQVNNLDVELVSN
jgi:hypothetical protein